MDPHLYFMQLLVNLPSWPASDLDAWFPDRWKQAHIACASRIAHQRKKSLIEIRNIKSRDNKGDDKSCRAVSSGAFVYFHECVFFETGC
jgi:hypothetical protein